MQRHFLPVAATAFFGTLLLTHGAQAQLLDQVIAGSVGTGTELSAVSQHATPEMIMKRLEIQGYKNITPSPNNPSQLLATTPTGMDVTLTVEPKTGQILSATPN